MKKLYILIMLLLSYGNLFSEWKLVDVVKMSMNYWDIDCCDNMNCFAVGTSSGVQSTYIKTIDGGYNWEVIYFDEAKKIYDSNGVWISTEPPRFGQIQCIDYVTSKFAVAGHKTGHISITRDGGMTWDSTQLNTDKDILRIQFIDSLTGTALSYRDIFITHDAGITWKKSNISFELKNLQMINENTVYAGQYQHFLKTTNAGEDWDVITIPFHSVNFHGQTGMYFINEDIGWISARMQASDNSPTYTNVIMKTTNAGENWELQLDTLIDPPLGLYGIYFADEAEGLAWGEGGIIWRTENGGEDWIRDESFPFEESDHFRDLVFPEGHTRKILANVYLHKQIWMYEENTSVKQLNKDAAKVFPNPSGNVLNITSEEFNGKKVKIVISNTTGQQFMDQEMYFSGSHSINTNSLPSGAYVMSLFCEGAVINKPFAVVR